MNLTGDRRYVKYLTAVGLLLLVALVVYLYPPVPQRFAYSFEQNRAWEHEDLSAPFDFLVPKTEDELQQDRLKARQSVSPRFREQPNMAEMQWNVLRSDTSMAGRTALFSLIRTKFDEVYQSGIIPASSMDTLQARAYTDILVEGVDTRSTQALYTPATAASHIRQELGPAYQRIYGAMDIARYLVPNLTYDSAATAEAVAAALSKVQTSRQEVREGQLIIRTNEVVDAEKYQVLSALRKVMLVDSKAASRSVLMVLSQFVLTCLLLLLFVLYLRLFRPMIMHQARSLLFLVIMMLGMTLLPALLMLSSHWSIYLIPFVILPIIVCVFFDAGTALMAHSVVILTVALMAQLSVDFLMIELIAGTFAVLTLKDFTDRSQLANTALWVFLSSAVVFTGLRIIEGHSFGNGAWHYYLYFGVSSLLLLLSYGLIYLFERAFGFMSSITLVELTNVNSNLMMRFAELAPGSFQHSVQVGNLATAAAKAVGANALLVRTGALYHDLGKMEHPEMFTENQQSGKNPLLEMPIEQAAQTVIRHVSDGIRIARKEKLPRHIIHFIETHHGTGKTKYFYITFKNQHPGVEPDEGMFTYPGPEPDTKETAILMMADAVEAASRSLQDMTEEKIGQLVERIIDGQIADGQFRKTPLTFSDIETIKHVLTQKIISINHHRIAYPEENKQPEPEQAGTVASAPVQGSGQADTVASDPVQNTEQADIAASAPVQNSGQADTAASAPVQNTEQADTAAETAADDDDDCRYIDIDEE